MCTPIHHLMYLTFSPTDFFSLFVRTIKPFLTLTLQYTQGLTLIEPKDFLLGFHSLNVQANCIGLTRLSLAQTRAYYFQKCYWPPATLPCFDTNLTWWSNPGITTSVSVTWCYMARKIIFPLDFKTDVHRKPVLFFWVHNSYKMTHFPIRIWSIQSHD